MRRPKLTGLVAFAVVAVTGVTITNKLALKAQANYYDTSFKAPDVAMVAIATKPVTKKDPIKYTVAYRDTIGFIAEKYNTSWERVYNKNPSMQSPADLKVGEEITIPAPDEVLPERHIPSSTEWIPLSSDSGHGATQPMPPPPPPPAVVASSPGNAYAPGNCTWYVKNRRPDLPNNLGNAYTWVTRARAQGLTTASAPKVGAVGQRGNHVVYVEVVNGDGTVTFSEMNYQRLYAITTRTLPAMYFTYIY